MDLADLDHNTRDGLHVASLGGAVMAAIAGFGGLRDWDGQVSVPPAAAARDRAAALRGRAARPAAAR